MCVCVSERQYEQNVYKTNLKMIAKQKTLKFKTKLVKLTFHQDFYFKNHDFQEKRNVKEKRLFEESPDTHRKHKL